MTIHKPEHPGLLVKSILIDHSQLSVTEAANHLGVSRVTLSRLLNGHAAISPEMAYRLSQLLNNSMEHWLNLQMQYDIWQVHRRRRQIKVKPLKNTG